MKLKKSRWLTIGLVLIMTLLLIWLLTTQNAAVWPIRHTIQYHAITWLSGPLAPPPTDASGTLQGTVVNPQNQPVEGAWVVVAYRNGSTFSARTNTDGFYAITNIPSGKYRPVAAAPGYQSTQFGSLFGTVSIDDNTATTADVTLSPKTPRAISPGQNFQLSEPTELSCTTPLESKATRYVVEFDSAGKPNQTTLFYTPITATESSKLPVLLAIYPGPADTWECASAPLAAAGYAVLATGPAYSFDLEADVDEQERVLQFAKEGRFPGADATRIGVLGGSYSTLHVQRLLQRGQENLKAAILLGPPTDLFDMRRRLEEGTYIPPFGLDKALIAMGLPSQVPLNYFEYSGVYHVNAGFPPLVIFHSRNDEIVPYQQSQLLANNLALVNVPHQLHLFAGASHYLMAEGGGALEIYQQALAFLERELQ